MWYLRRMVWSCWETPGLLSPQQLAFSDHQEIVFCWTKNHLFLLQSFSIFLVSENSLNTYLSLVLNLNFKLYHYASLLQRRENDWQVDVTVISSLNLKLMIIYCKEALTTDSTSPCSFSEKKDYEVIICKLLSLLKSCSKLQNRRAFKFLFRTGEVL